MRPTVSGVWTPDMADTTSSVHRLKCVCSERSRPSRSPITKAGSGNANSETNSTSPWRATFVASSSVMTRIRASIRLMEGPPKALLTRPRSFVWYGGSIETIDLPRIAWSMVTPDKKLGIVDP